MLSGRRMILLLAKFPSPSPPSACCLSFSLFMCVSLPEEGDRVWTRSQTIRPRVFWPSINHLIFSDRKAVCDEQKQKLKSQSQSCRTAPLKVVGNEKLGGLKFLQLLGIGLGLWRSISFFILNMPFANTKRISASALSSKINRPLHCN
jgi:hypothetical protein